METSSSATSIFSSIDFADLFNRSEPYNGTRVFILLLFIGACLGTLSDRTRDSLCGNVSSVLIEAKILKLISSIFVCDSWLWTLIHICLLIPFGLLIEKYRGTYQLISYIIQIALLSQIFTLTIFISLYYFTFDTFYLEEHLCGFTAMLGAFIISVNEISPNSYIIPSLAVDALTLQYLPFFTALLLVGLNLCGMLNVAQLCLIVCGMYISWIYIRFFAPNLHSNQERGNTENDDFLFVTLFPPLLRFPISLFSNLFYSVFKNVGCCEKTFVVSADLMHSVTNAAAASSSSSNLSAITMKMSSIGIHNKSHDPASMVAINMNHIGGGIESTANASHGESSRLLDKNATEKRMQTKLRIEQRIKQLQKDCDQRIIKQSDTATAATTVS